MPHEGTKYILASRFIQQILSAFNIKSFDTNIDSFAEVDPNYYEEWFKFLGATGEFYLQHYIYSHETGELTATNHIEEPNEIYLIHKSTGNYVRAYYDRVGPSGILQRHEYREFFSGYKALSLHDRKMTLRQATWTAYPIPPNPNAR